MIKKPKLCYSVMLEQKMNAYALDERPGLQSQARRQNVESLDVNSPGQVPDQGQ